MSIDLVHLNRDQQTGNHHSRPFTPPPLQPQSSSFNQKQPGIKQADESKLLDLRRTEVRNSGEQHRHMAIPRIQVHGLEPMLNPHANILMEHPENPDGQRD